MFLKTQPDAYYPFVSNASFLYPLKISENLTVFLCFQGVEKGCIGNKWIKSKSAKKFKKFQEEESFGKTNYKLVQVLSLALKTFESLMQKQKSNHFRL